MGSEKYQLEKNDSRMMFVFERIYVAVSFHLDFLLVVVVQKIRWVEGKQLNSKMNSERDFEDPF